MSQPEQQIGPVVIRFLPDGGLHEVVSTEPVGVHLEYLDVNRIRVRMGDVVVYLQGAGPIRARWGSTPPAP